MTNGTASILQVACGDSAVSEATMRLDAPQDESEIVHRRTAMLASEEQQRRRSPQQGDTPPNKEGTKEKNDL